MSIQGDLHARLQFLARVINRECKHLGTTDKGIFAAPFTPEHAKKLESDSAFAERVEAKDPTILASALQAGHENVPMLMNAASAMLAEMQQRGWLSPTVHNG